MNTTVSSFLRLTGTLALALGGLGGLQSKAQSPPQPQSPRPAHLATNVSADANLSWRSGTEVELIVNGGFEAGTFTGWTRTNSNANGSWVINNGSFDPASPDGPLAPFAGGFAAITDQNNPGQHTLYQNISIPAGDGAVALNWAHRIRNHAADFDFTLQYFRVEVRDTDNNVLAVPFSTEPGDPLLNDWTQRTFDLTPYRGQTVRIAFVEEDQLFYFNVHVDEVSVLVPGALPLTNEVYFGTNAALGPMALLGTTSDTAWDLPQLAPLTTYHWQVIARSAGGATPGPVWQFTTRGVDHFELSEVSSPQLVGVPFSLTLTARDPFNTPVTNFTGPVRLEAFTTGEGLDFQDGFEDGDFDGWTNRPGTYIREVVNDTAGGGAHSLTLIGGSQTPLDGVFHTLPDIQPDSVSFFVRSSSDSLTGGYVVLHNGIPGNQNIVAFFFMSPENGGMGLFEDVGQAHTIPYQANTWYQVRLDLDWMSRTIDYSVNGALIEAGIPFRGNLIQSLTRIDLYNFHNLQAWWDEFEFRSGDAIIPISISPTNSGNFTNGVWTGNVSVLAPTTNVFLVATDASGVRGQGNAFAVYVENDVAVTAVAEPEMLNVGGEILSTITVINSGPTPASNVQLTNLLPTQLGFVSVSSSAGTCQHQDGTIHCALGTLAGGAQAIITLQLRTLASGNLTNVVTVTRGEVDPYLPNNRAQTVTSVRPAMVRVTGTMLLAEDCLPPNGAMDPFEMVTVDFSLANFGLTGTGDLVATLLASPAVLSPSAPQNYGELIPGEPPVTRSFSFIPAGGCGSNIVVVFQLQEGPVDLGTAQVQFTLGRSTAALAEDFDGVTAPALPAGWTTTLIGAGPAWATAAGSSDTAPNALFCPDPATSSDNQLVSPAFLVPLTGSQVSFRHAFSTEAGYDFGTLEISIAGAAFNNIVTAGGSFVANGHPWDGTSPGFPAFITTIANLPATAAGQSVRLRWRFIADGSVPGAGWWVDSVRASGEYVCCANDDLSVGLTDTPDPIGVYANLTYRMGVTNSGPTDATAVILSNRFAAPVRFVSAIASQGGCTNDGGDLRCELGTLASGASAVVTLVVQPLIGGSLTNTMGVTRGEPDTILDNNHASVTTTVSGPSLTVPDTTTFEGHTGVTNLIFNVRLTSTSSVPVQVEYRVAPGTATPGVDYEPIPPGVLQFSPGQTTQTVTLTVFGDSLDEVNETVFLLLTNAMNAPVARSQALGTILDDDPVPQVFISDASVTEGDAGVSSAVFTVRLSTVSGRQASVNYSTLGATASAGIDFLSTNGSVLFNAGETSQPVTVLILGDVLNESNETFTVNLSGNVNLSVGDSTGLGTILDNDPLPTIIPGGFILVAEGCSPTNGAPDPDEQVTYDLRLRNTSSGGAIASNLTATLLPGGGVESPSPAQNYGTLAPGALLGRPFSFRASGPCGGMVTAVFQLTDGMISLGSVTQSVRLGGVGILLTQSFDTVTSPALPAGWTATLNGAGTAWRTITTLRETLPNSVFAPGTATTSDNQLDSPAFTPGSGPALVSFRHTYSTETNWDFGFLQISIGGAGFEDFIAAGGSWVTNGYALGARGWTGVSPGYPAFIRTVANLPASAAGQSVRLRWRLTTDESVSGPGWYVDSIFVSAARCCGPDPSLQFLSITPASGAVVLEWSSMPGVSYRLEHKATLPGTVWTSGGTVTATGPTTILTNSLGGATQRFYRLVRP